MKEQSERATILTGAISILEKGLDAGLEIFADIFSNWFKHWICALISALKVVEIR